MFDIIIGAITGSNPAIGLIAGLFWPLVSIPDLIKISALLVAAAILQLWARKRRTGDCCRRDA